MRNAKATLDIRRREVRKSRWFVIADGGDRDAETHHEEIDQIKIKEREGSFSSRAPSGQCVESLRRYLVGV